MALEMVFNASSHALLYALKVYVVIFKSYDELIYSNAIGAT